MATDTAATYNPYAPVIAGKRVTNLPTMEGVTAGLDPAAAILPIGAALGAGGLAAAPLAGATATLHPVLAALLGLGATGGALEGGKALKSALNLGGGAKTAAPVPAAPPAATDQPAGIAELNNLLSAVLGGEQGQVPQGYANFFTDVLGPMQQQLAQTFHNQLMGPLMGGTGAGVPGMSAADAAVVNKARGAESSDLDAMNQAAMTESGVGAQGLQQFVLGPIAQQQKQLALLQNALSFLPYSAAGIGNVPTAANPLLSLLQGQGLPTTAAGATGAAAATNPFATPAAGTIPVSGTVPKSPGS